MDANITVMMATKKSKLNVSSYFFNDKILGGLEMKIVKCVLKVKMIFGLCKALTHGQIKKLIKIEKIKN